MKKILKIVLPMLLGLLMVWSLTRKVEWQIVLSELEGISWGWVFISLVFAFFSHLLRGLRWRMQLRSFGINPSVNDMCVSVFGNYGLNLVLPRMGEVWRCGYMARNYKIPFSTTVGTMVSERLVDMFVAAMMAGLAFIHESSHFTAFMAQSDGGKRVLSVFTSPLLWFSVAGVVILLFVFAVVFRKSRLFVLASGFFRNMWVGVKGLKDVPHLWQYLLWSLAIWLCYYLNSYTCCFFFGFTEHLDVWAGLAIFVMGSLSLLLPVQGGLGPWHYAVGTALLCYGIGQELTDPRIQAFIWVSWSIEQGFVLLLGIYAMIVMSMKKKNAVQPN